MDGIMLSIDNNLTDYDIWPLAVGRKGNHAATYNAAIMCSLFGCCKAAGFNSREWLPDVLTMIAQYNRDLRRDRAELLSASKPSRIFQYNLEYHGISCKNPSDYSFFQRFQRTLECLKESPSDSGQK